MMITMMMMMMMNMLLMINRRMNRRIIVRGKNPHSNDDDGLDEYFCSEIFVEKLEIPSTDKLV